MAFTEAAMINSTLDQLENVKYDDLLNLPPRYSAVKNVNMQRIAGGQAKQNAANNNQDQLGQEASNVHKYGH